MALEGTLPGSHPRDIPFKLDADTNVVHALQEGEEKVHGSR